MTTHATAAARTPEFDYRYSTLADDIADRITIASPAELHDIHRDMWVQHAHGRLSVEDTEVLSEAYRTRLEALEPDPLKPRPGGAYHAEKEITGLGT
jgi:hypothetical protein